MSKNVAVGLDILPEWNIVDWQRKLWKQHLVGGRFKNMWEDLVNKDTLQLLRVRNW